MRSVEENPHGLHARYRIEKLYGEQSPDAVYFVLRFDRRGDDPIWTRCCRQAARELALRLFDANHLTEVAHELLVLIDEIDQGK